MSLRERIYSVLIVSASDSFSSAFAELVAETRYFPVHTAASVSAARRLLAENTFDFIIINAPLSDDMGICLAMDICMQKQSVVLLLIKHAVHDEIHDKVAEYGVFTLPKPTPKATMLQALNWMESARERLRQSEKKSLTVEEKMAEIRLVNRAKWILISECSMSEPEAHRYIEKQAMDRCISKRSIAEEIIKTYS